MGEKALGVTLAPARVHDLQGHARHEVQSQAPLCSCFPQLAAAKLPSLPRHPACSFGLRPPGVSSPLHLPRRGVVTEGCKQLGQLLTLGHLSVPTQMPTAALPAPELSWETQSPRGTGQPLASSLATKPWQKGHLCGGGTRTPESEGVGTTELLSLLLGNERD